MSGGSTDDIVLNAAQIAGGSEPLIVLEPLMVFLDGLGLGEGPLTAIPVGAGHSNVTFELVRGANRFVLRRPPRGPVAKSAHDVIREARLQQLVARHGISVPKVLAICESSDVIGAPFYVMGFVEGHVLERDLPEALTEPGAQAAIADAFVDALAELHAINIDSPGLSAIGRGSGYLERQLNRFAQVREQTSTRPHRELDAVGAWLASNRPTQLETTIVHGDYRLGNIMFDTVAPRIIALLDWEMATLGDPLADLGYMTASWAEPSDPEDDPMLGLSQLTGQPGFPNRAYLSDRYRARTGRELDHLLWYQVLALWKSAIFLEASYSRFLAGTTRDPFFAGLETGVPALARRAQSLVKASG